MLRNRNALMIERILRIGVFGTFLGHGIFALKVKSSWVVMMVSIGFSHDMAITLLPIFGVIDLIIAGFSLFKPVRIILIYAFIWAFITALARPMAGYPIWDFVERASNWVAPLVLLVIRGYPKNLRELFD